MSASMFMAVVRKELREHVNWSVLVLLGFAAALAYEIPPPVGLLRPLGVDLYDVFSSLETITTVGGVLAGLLLGAAQAMVENRGDKWGFLAHRPMSRTVLFWGKAMAGVLLYVISTGLPVAAALFWIASPGFLPVPFDWRIGLPAFANLLAGLVFYFAGLLTGMREARWYVSRGLGIGAAICCLLLQGFVAADFWQAIAISAAGLIIVGTAAWSTFIAGGQFGVQPAVGRVATGLSIGLGITLVGSLLVLVNIDRFAAAEPARGSTSTSYSVSSDGKVVKIVRDAFRTKIEISDLDGHLLSDLDGHPLEQNGNATVVLRRGAGVLTTTISRGLLDTQSFRESSRMYTFLSRASVSDPLSWYYVQNLGLIAAYDSQSHDVIGWMGPDGFSPGEAKPRPFGGRLKYVSPDNAGRRLLLLEDAAYRVDLDNRRIEEVFQRDPAETLLNAGSARLNAATAAISGENAEFEVISTTRRVIVQLRDGTRLLEAPQVADATRYPVLQVYRALRAPGAPIFLKRQDVVGGEVLISEFNSAGTMVNSWNLPAPNPAWENSWTQIAIFSTLTPLIGQAYLEISKPVFLVVAPQVELPIRGSHHAASWTLAILSSLISAAAVFLHGRRYAFPTGHLSTWMVIAFLLGPLGYLLMLVVIEWPARESCPACSRKRVVTRERCEHCGEPFAAQPKDGTEIFEANCEEHA